VNRTRIALATLVAPALAVTLAACGKDTTGGGNSPAEPLKIAIHVTGDTVDPNGTRIDVQHGQLIELDVTADAPGEIHVHSDPEQEFEYQAGTTKLTLTPIDKPGVVAVESHTLDKTIVQLAVN